MPDKLLLSVEAGRCLRVDETKKVRPDPAKGTLRLERLEEEDYSLVHLRFVSRPGESELLHLILFPGDARLNVINERVFALQFSSSDGVEFFYFQTEHEAGYAKTFADQVNQIIEPPVEEEESSSLQQPQTSHDNARTPLATSVDLPSASNSLHAIDLQDVITSSAIESLMKDPQAVEALSQHVPAQLQHKSVEKLLKTTQFRQGISSLQTALEEGAEQIVSTSLGVKLPADTTTPVQRFLKGVQEQANEKDSKSSEDSQMETD